MPKVLVAIDGSAHAVAALRAAAHLFGDTATYTLVSIIPPWSTAVTMAADGELDWDASAGDPSGVRDRGASIGSSPFTPTADYIDSASEALQDFYLTEQRRAAEAAGISAVAHVMEAAGMKKRRIGRQICQCAEQHDVDVIVVGPHGSSHAGEVFLGSVSQYILHHASRPVLVVRADD